MTRAWSLLPLFVLNGCFRGYPETFPCSTNDRCPDRFVCVADTCEERARVPRKVEAFCEVEARCDHFDFDDEDECEQVLVRQLEALEAVDHRSCGAVERQFEVLLECWTFESLCEDCEREREGLSGLVTTLEAEDCLEGDEPSGSSYWICRGSVVSDGECDCGCGARDPDCSTDAGAAIGAGPGIPECDVCHDEEGDPLVSCNAADGWTCSLDFFGTGDGCDCGCGVHDPDCPDTSRASCQYCDNDGACSVRCNDIQPDTNDQCL